jgi:hypothetical protein
MGEKTTRMSRKKKKTYEPEIMLERMSTNARREYIDRNDRFTQNIRLSTTSSCRNFI